MTHSDPNLLRASMLIDQRRWEEAEIYLRAALATNPDSGDAHAWLALCLSEQERFNEATGEAGLAIAADPNAAYYHFVLGSVQFDRNMDREALAATDAALAMDPTLVQAWGLRSSIQHRAKNYKEALEAADKGLMLDAEHVQCVNLRAMALAGLGHSRQAGQVIHEALRRQPDSGMTHANMGWTLLRQGRAKEAQGHFREALRLQPNLDHARAGVVEAIKARFFPHRLILQYFLWMSRLRGRAQWAVILLGYFGYQGVRSLKASHPELGPFLVPLMVAYIVFVVSTWLAYPLMNLALRLHPFGKLALSREQRIWSLVLGVVIGAAIAAWIAYWRTGLDNIELLALGISLLIPSAAMISTTSPPRNRLILGGYALLLVFLALVGAALIVVWPSQGLAKLGVESIAFVYTIAAFAVVWIANFLTLLKDPPRKSREHRPPPKP
jgi:tetratricopeptide (TPR) repeat protein